MNPADVHDSDSFLQFLDEMRRRLRASSEDWVNVDLDDFLEAMSAWVRAGHFPAHSNPWRQAAQLLLSASAYE